jgi:hypothetical protein
MKRRNSYAGLSPPRAKAPLAILRAATLIATSAERVWQWPVAALIRQR